MAARIRSLQNGINPVDEVSRDDLVIGDVVTVTSLDAATTYQWDLMFVPEGSAATFSGSSSAVSPGTFTVDLEGPYLVRLIVDAGLPTENAQYVRLRSLTVTLGLWLVSAGERRDTTGVIPVDVDAEGWANEQNANLQALEAAIANQTLAQVLVAGNVTGGTDLEVSMGDTIKGEDAPLGSGLNGSDLDLYPGLGDGAGLDGEVVVNGKLRVTGLIDPTGLVLDEEDPLNVPTGPNKGAVFVRDASDPVNQGKLFFKDATGNSTPVATTYSCGGEWSDGAIHELMPLIVLPDNHAYAFQAMIIGRSRAGVGPGDTGYWFAEGFVKRGVGAGTTVAGPRGISVTPVDQDVGALRWNVLVAADAVNGSITISVVGAVAETIVWHARVTTSEVGG